MVWLTCPNYHLTLFLTVRMNLDFKVYTMTQRQAAKGKSESSVSIDFLGTENDYLLVKTSIRIH